MVVYVLAFCMILLFIISFFMFKQEVVSPVIAFLAPFSLATIDLIYNIEKWNVDLRWTTFNVIIGGSICLIVSVALTRLFEMLVRQRCDIPIATKSVAKRKSGVSPIIIPKWNYYIFALLQAATFILCLLAVIKVARRYGIAGSISMMIGGYKNLKSFTTENVSLGTVCNILYDFCCASGYVWFYVVAKNYVVNKKVDKLALLNVCLSVAISLEKGSRGGAVALICSGAAMFVIFWQKNSRRGKLSMKQLLLIILAAIIVVGTFQAIGELLGRVSAADFEGYLAVYLAAPIRNLDQFLRGQLTKPDVFGKMSFAYLINYLGGELDIASWVYELDLPSLRANGFVTGNVYTTFYAYIYDFGYIGVPVMMTLMGIIAQTIYRKAYHKKDNRHSINFWMILYAYLFYSIAFSFFSNKFFEAIVSIQFFKYMLSWLLIRFFLERVKIRL